MKPKEISKKIFKILLTIGALTIAAASPSFIPSLLNDKKRQFNKKRIAWTFYRLKRCGLIKYKRIGKQIYISLTSKGKKYAQELQIDDLKIKVPRRWDGKWRIILFDIPYKLRIVREALRGKIKELGCVQLQKSVWIHPFDCRHEFEILKTFFNLPDENLMFIETTTIPFENEFKKIFNLK